MRDGPETRMTIDVTRFDSEDAIMGITIDVMKSRLVMCRQRGHEGLAP